MDAKQLGMLPFVIVTMPAMILAWIVGYTYQRVIIGFRYGRDAA